MKAGLVPLTGQVANPLNIYPLWTDNISQFFFLLCNIFLKGGLANNAQIMEMMLIKSGVRFLEATELL